VDVTDYGETLTHVPSRACTRRPALTRRSTIRAAASEETCSESSISRIVSTGTPLWTISSITERMTSARRAWSRRSGKSAGRSIVVRPAFPFTGGSSGDARPGLFGDDRLEQVGNAECEEVYGLVQRSASRKGLSVNRPAAIVHPVQIRAAVYSAVIGRLFPLAMNSGPL
jgi:hypothetical protein